LKKFALFQPFFKKVKDADEKLGRRTKMWVPASGQNRINATERVASLQEGDPEILKPWNDGPCISGGICQEPARDTLAKKIRAGTERSKLS